MKKTPHNMAKEIASLGLVVLGSMTLMPMVAQAEDPLELEFTYVAPKQQSQVAFVPFAGDSTISPVVLNNLSQTELRATSQNLPQQPHSSRELTGTLPVWQKTGIPYLAVGSTQSSKGKVVTTFEVIDVKTGRSLGGEQTLTANNDRASLRYAGHVIADKIYELITGTPGDFSGRIAYIQESGSPKDKTSQLMVMDADGENVMPISPAIKGAIFSPALSPDGNRIAYTVHMPNSYPMIYIQNVTTANSRPQVLTAGLKGSNMSPSFSPDGGSILFSGSHEGTANIYRISTSGGTAQKIIGSPYADITPNYSPDGQSFLYVSDPGGNNKPQINRYDFATGKVTKVSRGGYAMRPQYNADGTQIAFLSGSSAAIMNTSGAVVTNLGSTGIDEAPSFSPNGKRVVYSTKQGGKAVLTIKSLSGGDTLYKSVAGTVRSPVWSATPK